jgi:hypothetical protein
MDSTEIHKFYLVGGEVLHAEKRTEEAIIRFS